MRQPQDRVNHYAVPKASSAEGLSLLVTSENALSGASITAFRGLGQIVHDSLGRLTDSVDGTLADKQDFLENEILQADERIAEIDSNLTSP